MKEVINVNIGSIAFIMDRDAYAHLSSYLRDIKRRLPYTDTETMDDIELRIAEIFSNELQKPNMVISIAMTERAMSQIGRPEDFGTTDNGNHRHVSHEETHSNTSSLKRSRTDFVLGGVCGGIAKWSHIDSSIVRIITLLGILFGGISIFIYIILWIIIPKED